MSARVLGAAALLLASVALLGLTAGCSGTELVTASTTTANTTASTTTTSTVVTTSSTSLAGQVTSTSALQPVVVPTLPDKIPGYTEVDPATGLHVTGTAKVVDLATYRLKVSGAVARELSLTYDELRSMPKVTATPTLVCPGTFEDRATWSGVPLHTILEMAGPLPGAASVVLTGADGYTASIALASALEPENFLAYELAGQPLPVLHGFPVRAVFPGKQGSYWVKWLLEINVK